MPWLPNKSRQKCLRGSHGPPTDPTRAEGVIRTHFLMICGRSVVPFGHICSPRGTAKGKQLSKARPPEHVWRNASENPEKQTLQILQNRAPVYTGAPFSLRRHVPELVPKQHPFELVMDPQGIHSRLHGPFRGGYALWSNEATARRLPQRP